MTGILSFLASVPLLAAAVTGIGLSPGEPDVFESVEVGVAEVSPAGAEGGYMIPASGTSAPGPFTCDLTINPSTIDTAYGPDTISIGTNISPAAATARYDLRLYRHGNGLSFLGQEVLLDQGDSQRNRTWSVQTPRDAGTYEYELEVVRDATYTSCSSTGNNTDRGAAVILAQDGPGGDGGHDDGSGTSCTTRTQTLTNTCSVTLVVEDVPQGPDLDVTSVSLKNGAGKVDNNTIIAGKDVRFSGRTINSGTENISKTFQNNFTYKYDGDSKFNNFGSFISVPGLEKDNVDCRG